MTIYDFIDKIRIKLAKMFKHSEISEESYNVLMDELESFKSSVEMAEDAN